jgi:hypothetical protein
MITLYESILSSTKSGKSRVRLLFSKEYKKSDLHQIESDMYSFYQIDRRRIDFGNVINKKTDSCNSIKNFVSLSFLADKDYVEKLSKATKAAGRDEQQFKTYLIRNDFPIIFRMKYNDGGKIEEEYSWYPKQRIPLYRYGENWNYMILDNEILKEKELI